MRVRLYEDRDLEMLRRMHATQGYDYPFPSVDDPLFVSKLVLEGKSGQVQMAALARVTCETYLMVDTEAGTPRDRYSGFVELDRIGEAILRASGLEDAHAWLPPQISRRFGKRLGELGWVRDDAWTPYCKRLK